MKSVKRQDLLFKSKKNKKGEVTRIILRFSNKHTEVRNLLQKYWSVLTEDPILSSFVTQTPAITYRKAGPIRESLVQSEYKGEHRKYLCRQMGTFPCGECAQCPVINQSNQFTLPNCERFSARHFANCKTKGIVYLMQCKCGSFYIGKTQQKLGKQIGKHMYSMRIENLYLPQAYSITKTHRYKIPRVRFTVLDRIHIPIRGGDWNKTLLSVICAGLGV